MPDPLLVSLFPVIVRSDPDDTNTVVAIQGLDHVTVLLVSTPVDPSFRFKKSRSMPFTVQSVIVSLEPRILKVFNRELAVFLDAPVQVTVQFLTAASVLLAAYRNSDTSVAVQLLICRFLKLLEITQA